MFTKYIQKVAKSFVVPVDKFANYRWPNFPFGTTSSGDREMYEKLTLEAAQIKYPKIDEYDHEKGFAIDSEWFHNFALHTQVVIKKLKLCCQLGIWKK